MRPPDSFPFSTFIWLFFFSPTDFVLLNLNSVSNHYTPFVGFHAGRKLELVSFVNLQGPGCSSHSNVTTDPLPSIINCNMKNSSQFQLPSLTFFQRITVEDFVVLILGQSNALSFPSALSHILADVTLAQQLFI